MYNNTKGVFTIPNSTPRPLFPVHFRSANSACTRGGGVHLLSTCDTDAVAKPLLNTLPVNAKLLQGSPISWYRSEEDGFFHDLQLSMHFLCMHTYGLVGGDFQSTNLRKVSRGCGRKTRGRSNGRLRPELTVISSI